MSKPSTDETSPEPCADRPLRRAEIDAGELVLRKRGERGAVQPHDAPTLLEERERIEDAKGEALRHAAGQGWSDISAGRYADVSDDQLEDFISHLGRGGKPTR